MSQPHLAQVPVHGFVLAGGKSSRMGRDKALLELRGRSLVASGVERLRSFCTAVSIAGNREDLHGVAPVVREARIEAGPAAGLEAGLNAATEPWALFVPVDVPLVPEELLRRWAKAVLHREGQGVRLSFLRAGAHRQPTFCMLHRGCSRPLTEALDAGQRKLGIVFDRIEGALGPRSIWAADAERFAGEGRDVVAWFTNVNTPEDLAVVSLLQRKTPEVE